MDVSWIIEGLDKPGKSKSGLAKALGIWPSGVTSLLGGGRQLKATEAQKAAAYLEVDYFGSPLSTVHETVVSCVRITGDVAGGIWAEPGLVYQDEMTDVPLDPRWPADALYLLRVKGSSVNRKARDGDLVLCLDAWAAPRSAMPGDWVVMERERNGLIETTVKRVAEGRDGVYVLRPDSDDPAFQAVFAIGDDDGEVVRVKAFVLRFVREATVF